MLLRTSDITRRVAAVAIFMLLADHKFDGADAPATLSCKCRTLEPLYWMYSNMPLWFLREFEVAIINQPDFWCVDKLSARLLSQ
jgi:hypothetical protein